MCLFVCSNLCRYLAKSKTLLLSIPISHMYLIFILLRSEIVIEGEIAQWILISMYERNLLVIKATILFYIICSALMWFHLTREVIWYAFNTQLNVKCLMLQPSQVNLVWMKNTGDSKWHWAAQCTLALDTPFSLHSVHRKVFTTWLISGPCVRVWTQSLSQCGSSITQG